MEFKISKGMTKISILIFLSLFLISLILFYPRQEVRAQIENPETNSSIGTEENITYTPSSETHCSDEFCYEIYFNYSLIQKETDFNGDGIPDVISNVTFYNSTFLEIFVNDTRETGAYKWASAICNISGIRDIGKYEYNPATNVWSYTGSLNYGKLVNYGMPSDWCNDTNGYGFVLFGAGSGDKLYRLNFTSGYKELKIFTGKGSEILRFGSDKVGYYNNKGFDKLDVVVNASYPKIKLYKWNREDYLEVELPTKETSAKKMDKDKLTQEYSNFDVNLYPLWNITENGGFEFEIVLKNNKTNEFAFNLNSTDLEFYYQPPLYEEFGLISPNATCNATDCGGSHRPENIVGSYAVYHSTKRNNEYKTGKLFHIYRPRICDSNNNCIWAELNISDSILTVSVNKTWLDNAVYPVKIDPSFGYTAVGGSYSFHVAIRCSLYASGSAGGTVNSITAFVNVYSATEYRYGIYSEDSNGKSNLIGYSLPDDNLQKGARPPPDGAWATINANGSFSVSSYTNYYLCTWDNSGQTVNYFYDVGGATQRETYGSGTFDNWPNPITWDFIVSTNGYMWSIFANTTAGDTTPPTYSLNSTNSTLAGTAVSHNLKWTDNVGLSGFIFSFDNCTGSLANDTWTSMTGTGNWSNVTKIINSTVGCTIRWCVYANDTSNNWNGTSCVTPFSYVTTSANQPPFVYQPKTYDENLNEKTSFPNSSKVVIRVNVTDPQGASDISKVLITILNSTNNVKVNNATMTSISSITNGYTYEYNYTLPIDADRGTWTIKVYANDTQNIWGSNSTTFSVYLVLSKIVTQSATVSGILQKTVFLTKTQTIISSIQVVVARINAVIIRALTQPATVSSILQRLGLVGRIQTIIFSIQVVVARINVIIRPLTQSITLIISTIRKVVSTRPLTQPVSFIISTIRSISTTRELPQAIILIVSSIRNIIIYRFSEIVLKIVDIIWRSPVTKLAILFQDIKSQATIEKIIYIFRTQPQIINIQTFAERVSVISKGLYQTVVSTISLSRTLLGIREFPQALTLTLSVMRKIASYRISPIILTITSLISRSVNLIRESVATFGITLILSKAVLKPVEVIIAIISIISRSISSTRILSILPSIQAIATRVGYVSRELPQTISLTLIFIRNIISQRVLIALPSISLEISKLISSIRVLPQIISIIPTVLREIAVSRVVSLITNIIDVLSRTAYSIRGFVEIINVQILISKSIPIIRSLTETVNVITTVLREITIGRISMLAITMISVLTRTAYTIRALPVIATLTDLISKSIFAIREIPQALNVQVLSKAINIRISTISIAIAISVSRSIIAFKTILMPLAVSIVLKVVSPARYWLTLVSPPYGLFYWATRVENLILILLGLGGTTGVSLYYLFIHRRELIEHPIERYFRSERKEKKMKS